jgi:hypothetical protein
MAEHLTFIPLRMPALRGREKPPAAPAHAPAIVPPPAIRWTVTALVLGIVLLERVAVGIGSFYLGVGLPLMYLMLLVLLMNGRLSIDPVSLLIYSAIAAVAVTSYLLNANINDGHSVSISSMYLLLALYLPLVFTLAPHHDNHAYWMWTMRMVGNVLLVVALLGIVQFYAQFAYRPSWMFDISTLIPTPIRGQGVYNSAIPVGSVFKANGFVSREPSGFSYLMAFGLLIELAFFKRWKRMACFALALVVSYSGTGLLALAIGVLLPLRAKLFGRLAIGAGVILGANAMLGDPMNVVYTLTRVTEFTAPGSSAYMRYVAPLHLVNVNFDLDPWSALLGHGPGMISRVAGLYDSHDPTWAKLLFEYGIVGFIVFVGFLAYKLSAFPAPFQFRAVLLSSWLLMGGHLLSPENVGLLYAVLALWPQPPMAVPKERRWL